MLIFAGDGDTGWTLGTYMQAQKGPEAQERKRQPLAVVLSGG